MRVVVVLSSGEGDEDGGDEGVVVIEGVEGGTAKILGEREEEVEGVQVQRAGGRRSCTAAAAVPFERSLSHSLSLTARARVFSSLSLVLYQKK